MKISTYKIGLFGAPNFLKPALKTAFSNEHYSGFLNNQSW